MKKFILIIIGLILLIIVGTLIWWFTGSRSKEKFGNVGPGLKLANFNIKEMNPENIIGELGVHLSNTLPVTLKTDSLQYELWIDSVRVMKENYPKSIELKKNDSLTVTLPFDLKYAKLKNAVKKFDKKDQDSADYTFISKFETKVPILGQRQFKIQFSKRLPMLKPISVSSGNFKLHKLGLRKTSVGIDVIFKNENAFPIHINHPKFSVQVEKDMHMDGDLKDNVDIPAKGTVAVPMRADIKLTNLPKLGWEMLFQKGSTNYAFDFKGRIESKYDIVNNSLIHLVSTGTMKDLIEMKKAK